MEKKDCYINPLTKRAIRTDKPTYKKLTKATTTIQSVIKRKLVEKAKEPPKPKAPPKEKTVFADIPKDIRLKIAKLVLKDDDSFNSDKATKGGSGIFKLKDYINFMNERIRDKNMSFKYRNEIREDLISYTEVQPKFLQEEVKCYFKSYRRKEKAYLEKYFPKPENSWESKKNHIIVNGIPFEDGEEFCSSYYGNYVLYDDGTFYKNEKDEDADLNKLLFGNKNIPLKSVKRDKRGEKKPKYKKFIIEGEKEIELYNKWVKKYFGNKDREDKREVKEVPMPREPFGWKPRWIGDTGRWGVN